MLFIWTSEYCNTHRFKICEIGFCDSNFHKKHQHGYAYTARDFPFAFYYLTEFTILYFLSSPSIPLMWVLLIIMLVLLRLAYDVSFASSYIFLNNSVTPDKLGSINGLAGSLTAFFR